MIVLMIFRGLLNNNNHNDSTNLMNDGHWNVLFDGHWMRHGHYGIGVNSRRRVMRIRVLGVVGTVGTISEVCQAAFGFFRNLGRAVG